MRLNRIREYINILNETNKGNAEMKTIITVMMLVALSACTTAKKEKSTMTELKQDNPVQCATAKGDLRALQAEKAHVGREIGAGVGAIVPISLVVNRTCVCLLRVQANG